MPTQRVTSQLPSDERKNLINRLEALPENATFIRDRKNQAVFKLKVNGTTAFIEVDGKSYPIERDPATADRRSPPTPDTKHWKLA